MDKCRKKAREWLKGATLTSYLEITKEAKLTPRQEQVLSLIVLKDESVVKISMDLCVDESVIKHLAKQAYDKVSKVLMM